MRRKKKSKLRKILKGLFSAKEEELSSYFAPEVNTPDEYCLVACLFKKYGPKPISARDTEVVLFECLRELCPDDCGDDVVEAKVREFIDYGFVERWNDGDYW
ncbi:hypothetical protein AMJ40_06980 [candidate division TA06 bacterium DG_26]|uniref:Uncharacterized protein n=1 Tax=candidate division TA06 bacterium DG_26 TaxID=1703771 RepID=A0A0S7WF04_UNCT6|nr:MAG: hypothetical protein AMJ40_06980 [candidate division TA06 bacterium DG_26]